MKDDLRRPKNFLQIHFLAAMLPPSFMVTQSFFNDLLYTKQSGIEIIHLFMGAMLIVALITRKHILFTKKMSW